jgi:hypothetical protein
VRISDVSPIYSPFVSWLKRNPAPKPHPLCHRDPTSADAGFAHLPRVTGTGPLPLRRRIADFTSKTSRHG